VSILSACKPRQDIITGSFNPEIFTASLSEVMLHYREGSADVHSIYTDASQFFSEATYPTDGLKMVLAEVFGRLAGDNSVPAIHRLETAFGGGKTHTLIACTHIAFKGADLASVTASIIDGSLLPAPGEVAVVGVAGDEIPVHMPQGAALVPYTLWGEIAYQIGGKELYKQVEAEATSHAAPGRIYFDTVLKGRKVLIMLDELAQYAARLSAARGDGADQLAAFMMALHGYARINPGISIVLTLASTADAFANQTDRLASLLSSITGSEMSKDAALGIGQQAIRGVSSVVARDATAMVPVQAAEISRVLGKRLFTRIDSTAARQTAQEYAELYAKSASMLPGQATRDEYKERMAAHYPFHPTLIDFLNNKLAASEDFQGTRGVLRVLALAVRTIWKRQADIPMIHACHLDLRDARTVNELTNRTGSGELLPVLNADIGGVDTESIEGGKSNAELADLRNPHPDGWPMYEYTWKTVFLHSLVGRDQGIGSNLFGLTQQDALFDVSFPGLTPSQVGEALREIKNSAFYLRFNQGRYYASLDPSVNIALARIRRSHSLYDIDQVLDVTARKVVSQDIRTFNVVHDVAAPEHIPDKKGKPTLALISLNAGRLDVTECVTTAGPNTPRIEQNLVFLLIPDTVAARHEIGGMPLFNEKANLAEQARSRLRELGRSVLAMQKLNRNPDAYGINPHKLEEDNFHQRFSEREKALETAVTQSYKSLWFPSATGQIVRKEIRTGGGESGMAIFEQIRKVLLEDGELVTAEHDTQGHLKSLANLFFGKNDTVTLAGLRQNFCRIRSWPILDTPDVFDQLIRSGVQRGVWCLFQMGPDEDIKPDEFYSKETGDLPLNLDLSRDYSLINPNGARQRGWTPEAGPDRAKVKDYVRQALSDRQAASVMEIRETVASKYGDIPHKIINEAVSDLVKGEKAMAFKGKVGQDNKPDQLLSGTKAVFFTPESDDVIITPAKASEKGWIDQTSKTFSLSGRAGARVIMPLLRRIGSLYNRGGKSFIDDMDLTDLVLPRGGRMRLSLSDVPPESMKDLAELFEVIADLTESGDDTEAYVDIYDPLDDCTFIREIKNNR